ncbi:putative holin-like toxin [Erwinia sp. CPCC 100877]|nr:putative holin-like toxin [Erwinia sp. CPCC 100877]
MYVLNLTKGESLLSALETIQLILSFGMFTIALVKLIVELLKNDKKNNRHIFGQITVIFNL